VAEEKQLRLPDVGEGLTEADILKWLVQPGDRVKVHQSYVEIETAKSAVELPCPYDGVVAGLLVPEGVTVDVGTPIMSLMVDGEDGASGPPPVPQGSTSADLVPPASVEGGTEPGILGTLQPKEEGGTVLVGYGVKTAATARRARKARAASAARATGHSRPAAQPAVPAADPAVPAAPPPARPAAVSAAGSSAATGISAEADTAPGAGTASTGAASTGAVLAKPPVRKLAKDLGIDLSAVPGTGPGGSVTRDDVQSAARAQDTAEPGAGRRAPVTAVAREERIPVRGVRKHTAEAVTASAFTAPHVTEFLQADVTETMTATARLRSLPEFAEIRVSPLLLVARALLVAVARHPMINSSWDGDAEEIVVKHYVNLGIAAATERGLVVPNIKDAHALSLPGLARALAELAGTARAGKATPADLSGGTVTITNVGVFGVDAGTPILPPGETAILAFGQVRDAPWVHQGQLAIRKVATLALSFDHRIVDGDLGSAVLRDIGAMLEDPLRMLAWS
jgi:pyruvate dehydrogenase E2 component (dihydrolipoamide acetyltransferase)